jgi:hypothetical protein
MKLPTMPRWFIWVWALGVVVNAYGAWIAYGWGEMLHGHIHVVLTPVFAWLTWQKAKANAAATAD